MFNEKQKRTVLALLKKELVDQCDQHYKFGHDREEEIKHLESTIRELEPDFDRTNYLNLLCQPPLVNSTTDMASAKRDFEVWKKNGTLLCGE